MHGFFPYDERRWVVGGAGRVGVNDRNRLIGNFVAQASWELAPNIFVDPETLSCELDGSLRERQSMLLRITCSGDGGVAWNELVEFAYAGHSYEYQPSSLEAIAGNYTLPAGTQTNTLNINSDGVVFGIFHLGLTCTVNGQVSLIDTRFNMYWMEWRFFELLASATQVRGRPIQRARGAHSAGRCARTRRWHLRSDFRYDGRRIQLPVVTLRSGLKVRNTLPPCRYSMRPRLRSESGVRGFLRQHRAIRPRSSVHGNQRRRWQSQPP